MFSFNQPNCITHCLPHEAPRCRGRGDSRVGTAGMALREAERTKGGISQYLEEFWKVPKVACMSRNFYCAVQLKNLSSLSAPSM